MTIEAHKHTVTGALADDAISVPEFSTAFYDGELIEEYAHKLLDSVQEFSWFAEGGHTIDCVWKRTGGMSQGKPTLGRTIKVGGYEGFRTGKTFRVWMAADHCRGLTAMQFEASVYHQLMHMQELEVESRDGDDTKLVPAMRGHDIEMFRSEYQRYGAWNLDIARMRDTVEQQLKLDLGTDTTVPARPSRKSTTQAAKDYVEQFAAPDEDALVTPPDSPIKTPVPFVATAAGRAARKRAASANA